MYEEVNELKQSRELRKPYPPDHGTVPDEGEIQ